MYKKWYFSVVLTLLTVVPSVVAASFDHNLYYGLTNDSDVITLQTFLTEQGVYTGLVNGNFFTQTKKAVINFQTQENILPAHGYFGRKTRIAANVILEAQASANDTVNSRVSAISSSATSVSPDEVKSNTSKSTEPTLDTVVAELVQDEVALHDLSTKFDTLNDEMSSVSSAVDALNAQIAMLQSALTVFSVTGSSPSVADPMPLLTSPSTPASTSGAPSATSTLRLSTSTLSAYMLLHATSTKLLPVLLHAPVSKPTLAPTTKVVVPAPIR